MDSMILILVATIIFLPYMIYQYRRKKVSGTNVKYLHQVEAGPTKNLFVKRIDLTSPVAVDMGGITLNPETEYFVVKNQCMKLKGISDGDIVGVRMFKDGFVMPENPKKKLMLLIYLDDKYFKGYKIREQGEITDDGKAYNTYHYKGGVQNMSSKPHNIETIKGIVTEVYQRQLVV